MGVTAVYLDVFGSVLLKSARLLQWPLFFLGLTKELLNCRILQKFDSRLLES